MAQAVQPSSLTLVGEAADVLTPRQAIEIVRPFGGSDHQLDCGQFLEDIFGRPLADNTVLVLSARSPSSLWRPNVRARRRLCISRLTTFATPLASLSRKVRGHASSS
jgi:hypothetical protein